MALTQESLLSFLLERGGKVRNSELLNNFRSQISGTDPAQKQHNRELFKSLVNSVAVVKQIDEVKFVVVKKRYQDFVKELAHDGSQKAQLEEDSLWSQNISFSCSSPSGAESSRMIYSDIENNNVCGPCGDGKHGGRPSRRISGADVTTVKVLNIPGDQASKARKSGSVFAVIAVKSPLRPSAPAAPDKPVTTSPVPTVNANLPASKKGAVSDSQWTQSRQAEDVQPPLRPQSRRDEAKYPECVPLEPVAHEWLVKCAAGLWGQIHGLLLQDNRLAQKKDFMSGFTALHWAAKNGNSEMVHKLVEVSRKKGTCVNVNSKAHGGYTPLHIAAIHGHTEVMLLLVQSYGASVNERDNGGKKALHYLGKGVSAEVRGLLGGRQQGADREHAEDGEYREHKGLNTISKLFQPHIGKKQKTRFAHDW